ncbi:MAG: THUMP domain-containing class I SAM-dependent RNA methyltransferase [Ferruginibacter sp.]
MELFTTSAPIIITCSNRIAPYLEMEVVELGYKPVSVFKTGVQLFGTLQDCIRLNLNLRCASQVLFSIKKFKAIDADSLYAALHDIPWEAVIPPNGYFSITSNVQNETINNNLFANVRVKDAIVDRFREKSGHRPDSGSALTGTVIHLFWRDEQAEIFVDTSGETLSKHGYRKIPGKAPMLESLAAATILASGWNRKTAFVNPMCGSSTLAIEAALMASNRKPGMFRTNYAFMHLMGYTESMVEAERKRIDDNIITENLPVIIASDISADAVNISKINAGAAGVADMITFYEGDFEITPMPQENQGVVFFNPEYGDRLGVEKELEATYSRIGDFMKKKCTGYTGFVFTGNLELAKRIGLKPKRRIEFFNSKIDCRLLSFELYGGSRKLPVTDPINL